MLQVERKYVDLIGQRLTHFRQIRERLWNFRCPICGDSSNNTKKKRGYIGYNHKKNRYLVHCHKCLYSASLPTFLKDVDKFLYEQFITERFLESGEQRVVKRVREVDEEFYKEKRPLPKVRNPHLLKVSKLKEGHYVKRYLEDRMIPAEHLDKFFVVAKFKAFANSVIPGTYKSLEGDYPRLVLEIFNKDGDVCGYQCRAFGDETPKYMKLDIDDSQVYGIERVDPTKRVFVVEGHIDSLFLDNCVAVGGVNFDNDYINSLEDKVIIFDNEPRSRQIRKILKETILKGYKVVIWNKEVKGKDINTMVLLGYTQEFLKDYINRRTFQGLTALNELAFWK